MTAHARRSCVVRRPRTTTRRFDDTAFDNTTSSDQILVSLLLLNVALSIVIEAYDAAKASAELDTEVASPPPTNEQS